MNLKQGDTKMRKVNFMMLLCVAGSLATSGCVSVPLHDAIVRNDVIAVKELLSQGVDVNQVDPYCSGRMTPLSLAVEGGRVDLVKLLLDGGADVNLAPDRGMPALCWAGFWGRTDAARLLIEKGADVEDAIARLRSMRGLYRGGSAEDGIEIIERLSKRLAKPGPKDGDTGSLPTLPTALPMPKESAAPF